MVNPYAYFDALSLMTHLHPILGGVATGEIQLFAYLSRLLCVYEKLDICSWNYEFATTPDGGPYSRELTQCLTVMTGEGILSFSDNLLSVTSDTAQEYDLLSSLSENSTREKFLDAACACCLSLPVGFIRSAITKEPYMLSSRMSDSDILLLGPESPSLRQLFEQFNALHSAWLVPPKDLMVPAVIWLRYLYQSGVPALNLDQDDLNRTC